MADVVDRLRVIFIGEVQGVGFRYTVKRAAERHPSITGMVKNLPDGNVEFLAEGPKPEIDALYLDICETMDDYIRDAQEQWSRSERHYRAFGIEL